MQAAPWHAEFPGLSLSMWRVVDSIFPSIPNGCFHSKSWPGNLPVRHFHRRSLLVQPWRCVDSWAWKSTLLELLNLPHGAALHNASPIRHAEQHDLTPHSGSSCVSSLCRDVPSPPSPPLHFSLAFWALPKYFFPFLFQTFRSIY